VMISATMNFHHI